jgi:hypothetical protein
VKKEHSQRSQHSASGRAPVARTVTELITEPARKIVRLSEYPRLFLGSLQVKSPKTSPPDNVSVAILR